jgi:hypothetical protein
MVVGLGLFVCWVLKSDTSGWFGIGRADREVLSIRLLTMKWSKRIAQGFSPGFGSVGEVP